MVTQSGWAMAETNAATEAATDDLSIELLCDVLLFLVARIFMCGVVLLGPQHPITLCVVLLILYTIV